MRFLPRNEPREEELAALLDEQRRAVELVRGAAPAEAPAGLRARIERERRPGAVRTRRRVWAAGVAATALAAAALVLVLAVPENVPGGPAVADAAVLATRPATGPAPPPRPGAPTLLARAVDGVPYPSWTKKFGWKAVGSRVDTLDGRRATTVFYAKNGRRIGYTIFAGSPLHVPSGAAGVRRDGTELRLLTVDGRPVVTWLRRGRTCIITGAGVGRAVLEKLAAWNGKGTVPF